MPMVLATRDATVKIAAYFHIEAIYLKDFGNIANAIIPQVLHESGVWLVIHLATLDRFELDF